MTATRTVLATVTVGSTPLDSAAVRSVRVEQSLHVPDQATVRLADAQLERVAKGIGIGLPMEVVVDVGDGEIALFQGEITSVGLDLEERGRTEAVLVGLDRSHRLARGTKVRTFTEMGDREIIAAIAGDHGLQAKVDASASRHPYLLQHGTDFDLVSERALALGCRWWVEDRTLRVAPAPAGRPVTLEVGTQLRSFRLRVSAADGAEEVVVQGWDPVAQQTLRGRAPAPKEDPATGVGTDADLPAKLVRQSRQGTLKTGRFLGWATVATASEADALARSLAHQVAAEQVLARGEAVGDPAIRPGSEITTKAPGGIIDGRYLVTSAVHLVDGERAYLTRFEAGGRHDRTLVDLLSATPRHRTSTAPAALVVGIVTNARDPQRHGRVKVKYPTLSSQDESAWARVASVGAGPDRGLHVIPDVGDEVLVGFEHGDLRRPIVIGGLWSGKQAHPKHGQEQSTGAVWRTKAGHVLEMSDGPGTANRFVTVTLADGKTSLRIAEDGVEVRTPNGLTLTADGGGKVTVKGQLTISADAITVSAKQRLVLEGKAGVSLDGGRGPVSVKGATVEAGGTAKTSLGGNGTTEVKGSVLKLN